VAENSESFGDRAASKGLDADRLQASLNRIKAGSPKPQEKTIAQGGAEPLRRLGQEKTPAQMAGEAVAQEEGQRARTNKALYGLPNISAEDLPSQTPPPSATGVRREMFQEQAHAIRKRALQQKDQ